MNALNTYPKTLAALVASILLALGCATQQAAVETPSPVDVHWGESYRQVVAEQIASPEAGQDSRPTEGLSANDADAAIDYQRARQSPDYQNTPRPTVLGRE
jgi:uncharacterized lipoprotein YajG